MTATKKPERAVLEPEERRAPAWFDLTQITERHAEPGDADHNRRTVGRYTHDPRCRTFALLTHLNNWVLEWRGIDLATGRDAVRYRQMTTEQAAKWFGVCRLPVPPSLLDGAIADPIFSCSPATAPAVTESQPEEKEVMA